MCEAAHSLKNAAAENVADFAHDPEKGNCIRIIEAALGMIDFEKQFVFFTPIPLETKEGRQLINHPFLIVLAMLFSFGKCS